MLNSKNVLKIAEIALSVVGIVVGIATDHIETRKMEELITEKVAEALAERNL